ncbi:MAG: ABC transporter permease [Acidobacteria bacterium]|nr:ABC transporter permease [Acidobacteriota bacterium]
MAWTRRLLNTVCARRTQTDIEREIAFHLREREEELREQGMSAPEAARMARMQFGSRIAHIERTRDMDLNLLLDSLYRNLRFSLRSLRKSPVFTLAAVLTLALGIGVNSAVFSVVDAVLLRPLPFPESEQLVELGQANAKSAGNLIAPVRLEEWNRLNSTFEAISGYYQEDASELSGDMPERLRRAFVAPRFFQILGVAPALGRDLSAQEQSFSGPRAVLISDRLWRRRFAADPNVTRKALRFGRTLSPIIGVMPPQFAFPASTVDVWSGAGIDAPYAQGRDLTWFTGIGRLKPRLTLEQAQSNLAAVQAALGKDFPKSDGKLGVSLTPLKDSKVGGVRRTLWILFGSVTLLLLLACANVTALFLSRATARAHDIAVRFSLGASKGAVAGHLLTEVGVIAFIGALLGLLMASGTASLFRRLARDLPRLEEITLDWRILAYSLAAAAVTTMLCGLLPVLRSSEALGAVMNQSGRGRVQGRSKVQFTLVGIQVALAVTLLAAAGLLVRSFLYVGQVAPGFDADNVISFHLSVSWNETGQPDLRSRLERILEGMRAIPGVANAATSITLPGAPTDYTVEFKTLDGPGDPDRRISGQQRYVTPSYFETMRIPLLAGEMCQARAGKPTAVVNNSFARVYFPGETLIGRRLTQPGNAYIQPGEVVGIVGDARETGMHEEPRPTLYWCGAPFQPRVYFLVRADGKPSVVLSAIRYKLRELEPNRSVYDLMLLRDRLGDSYSNARLRGVLLSFFALTAVSLACIGLYGTLSYLVNVRQKEIGVRMALGASRAGIVSQFLMQGLRVALFGCVAGLCLVAAGSKLLTGLLFGVVPSDPWNAIRLLPVCWQ